MENKFTFAAVRRDLVSYLYGIAHALDKQVRAGAGAALLNLPPDSSLLLWPDFDDFDLSTIDVADGLDTVYRYAFYGELTATSLIVDDEESGNLGRISAMLEIVHGSSIVDAWHDEVRSEFIKDDEPCGGLYEMVQLASARLALDESKTITLREIALLAGIDERSVRNALHADGSMVLVATRNEDNELVVEQAEALRWLRRREKRGFKETVRIGHFGPASIPDSLAPGQIMPFIHKQIDSYFGGSQFQYLNAGNMIGWPEERVRALVHGSLEDINPDDCKEIARMLLVDTSWFTAQVMQARFPHAMKELAPVTVSSRAAPTPSPMNEEAATLDVTLTAAGIRNGYLDIERRYASRFFPADCFGSRGGDQPGQPVLLHHDVKGSPYSSDLRVKSEALVSPRKRFSAYFTAHSVKAGDIVRFTRLSERSYQLSYLSR